MKVILLKDIQKVGKKYDVKEVSQGYGMNFLVKRGLAKVATPQDEKKAETMKREEEVKKQVSEELIKKILSNIDGKEITLKSKANEKGHLFSALNIDHVAKAIGNQLNIEIEKNWIILKEPVKEITKLSVPIETGKYKATVILNVEAE